jgi:transposase
VEVAGNFPDECRYVLEMPGQVYGHDAEAREFGLTPEERLRLHQERSGPVMDQAAPMAGRADRRAQDRAQLRARQNDHVSVASLAASDALFLRIAGAPVDNNIVERALKRAVLHRKNALFYRTLNGAQVGDLFMSLIRLDSHLPVVRRQLPRLSGRVAAPRSGPGGQRGQVDSVELPRDTGGAWSIMSLPGRKG